MSGEGVAAFGDDGRLVATDAVTTAIVDTIIAERAGVLGYARAQAAVIDQMIASRRITASEATLLKERLRAFADGIAIGLHCDGVEHPRVRAALREIAGGTVPSGAARGNGWLHLSVMIKPGPRVNAIHNATLAASIAAAFGEGSDAVRPAPCPNGQRR